MDVSLVSESFIRDELIDIFTQSLNIHVSIPELIQRCHNLINLQSNKNDLNISRILLKTFEKCLQHLLVIGKSHNLSNSIENSIAFVSALIVHLIETCDSYTNSQISYQNILTYLLANHKANSETIRMRICQILNQVFGLAKKNSSISESVYKKAQVCLLERIRDLDEDVQCEAIEAIKCLQDPKDKYCPVINNLASLLKMSAFNSKSRLSILNCLVLNRNTLSVIQKLIYDTNAKLRLKTFEIIIRKVPLKLLTTEYINDFIHLFMSESDFDDALANELATKLMKNFDNDMLKLIESLKIKETNQQEQVSLVKLMGYVFKLLNETCVSLKTSFDELFDFSSSFEMWSFERAFLCFSILWYLRETSDIKLNEFKRISDEIMSYLHANILLVITQKDCSNDSILILKKMFEMIWLHELDYESNRLLRRDLSAILVESSDFKEPLFELIIENMLKTELQFDVRIEILIDLVDLLSNSEKTNETKLLSCLFVICLLLSMKDLCDLNDAIEKKIEYFVLPNLTSNNVLIRMYAVRSLGLSCLLSKEIAINYLLLFFKIVQNDESKVSIEAIKIIFNIILSYDLENSEFTDDEDSFSSITYPNLIPIILKYLSLQIESNDENLRSIACEGFAKLFLSNRINDHEILFKLLLILFDSTRCDKTFTSECLSCFFTFYVEKNLNPILLEKALIVTLDWHIRLSPTNTSNVKLDIKKMAKFFTNRIYFLAKDYRLADKVLIRVLNKMKYELDRENLNHFSKYLKFYEEFYVDLNYEEGRHHRMVEEIAYNLKFIINKCKTLKHNLKQEFKDHYDQTRSLYLKYYNLDGNITVAKQKLNLTHDSSNKRFKSC